MLDLHVAAALSALPGALGCHLLSACRTRRSALDPSAEVAALADFDLDAELGSLFAPDDAALRAARARQRGAQALDSAAARGILPLPFGHPDYPPLLSRIVDPPPMLWTAGRVVVLREPAVAIVGSRAAGPLALEIAGILGRDLAPSLVVTSGLARGVDAAAHRGALETGQTVAVLGSGVDIIYPSEHRLLADAICVAGALVSEAVPGTPPRRHCFPRRNRLISGMSLGVVVVEASPKSGSLITARVALDQGREVMAVPGAVTGDRNRGAHGLIRDGAVLVEQAADVLSALGLEALGPVSTPAAPIRRRGEPDLLLQRMTPGETYDLERLMASTGEPAAAVLRRLLDLELAGAVARVPGGRFFRPAHGRKDEVVR
jgi:DNA processing protein